MADATVEIQRRLTELTWLTPDLIAQKLELAGISGSHAGQECPIANYLRPACEEGDFLYVGSLGGIWFRKKGAERGLEIKMPASVQEFIRLFDRGNYKKIYLPNPDEDPIGEIDV